MGAINDKLAADAKGLRLARVLANGDLRLWEPVMFVAGREAVEMMLRRAWAVGGYVEIGDDVHLEDYFADVMSDDHTMTQNVALDRKSFRYLYQHLRPIRFPDPEGQPT